MKTKLLAILLCALMFLTGCGAPAAEDTPIDIDLTALSSTMVYSEVYNIMSAPEAYRGKTVKVDGLMVSDYDDNIQQEYYAVLIEDATACCQQGIEFVCNNTKSLPADGTRIELTGEFGSYDAGGNTFYCIYCDEVHSL